MPDQLLREQQEWIAVVRNPISGKKSGKNEIRTLVQSLQARGFHVRLFSKRDKISAELAREHVRGNLRCLVIAGGDGSINDALNRYPAVPLAVLPTGTENLFAKYVGIGRSGAGLAEVIADNHRLDFDVPLANGRKFLLMASCGIDADIVQRTDARRTGNITKFSYVQPILESIRKYQYPEFRVFVDDEPEPLVGRFLIVSNCPAYALQMPFATKASPFDGILDVRLFEKGSSLSTIRYAMSVAMKQHEKLSDVTCLRGRNIRIKAEKTVPVQLDGDPFGFTPLNLELTTDKATFFVPRNYYQQNQPGSSK